MCPSNSGNVLHLIQYLILVNHIQVNHSDEDHKVSEQ